MPTSCLLAAKDIRQRLRDRSAILIAVVVPLSLAFVLSLVFGQEGVPSPFRYGVVDLDRGPAAETFRTGALDALVQDDIATLRRVETADEARRLVESGALDAAFVLPSGFSTASSTAGSASLDVFGSVDAPTASEVARSVARSFTTDLNGARVAAAAAAGIGTGGRDRS
ncbi:MAG: ABC transporter permease, partial [Dactylosporangium sp.]|nr:ABC transporter permease [Dactylosporangium sp.]NNJ63379.1 ABC transporter permease [Dactylosporangium sp.]